MSGLQKDDELRQQLRHQKIHTYVAGKEYYVQLGTVLSRKDDMDNILRVIREQHGIQQEIAFPFKETYEFLYSNHKDVLEELEEHLALTKETEGE